MLLLPINLVVIQDLDLGDFRQEAARKVLCRLVQLSTGTIPKDQEPIRLEVEPVDRDGGFVIVRFVGSIAFFTRNGGQLAMYGAPTLAVPPLHDADTFQVAQRAASAVWPSAPVILASKTGGASSESTNHLASRYTFVPVYEGIPYAGGDSGLQVQIENGRLTNLYCWALPPPPTARPHLSAETALKASMKAIASWTGSKNFVVEKGSELVYVSPRWRLPAHPRELEARRKFQALLAFRFTLREDSTDGTWVRHFVTVDPQDGEVLNSARISSKDVKPLPATECPSSGRP